MYPVGSLKAVFIALQRSTSGVGGAEDKKEEEKEEEVQDFL